MRIHTAKAKFLGSGGTIGDENDKGFAPIIIIIIGIIAIFAVPYIYQTIQNNTSLTSRINLESSPTPIPTPIPTGSLSGKIVGGYYARPIANVKITANGPTTKDISSDGSGNFSFSNLEIGNYNLIFESSEYNFSSFSIEIKEGENKLDKNISGPLSNPKPMAFSGYCFIDSNKNSVKDSGENSIDAVANLFFYESNSWVLQKNFNCGASGNISSTLAKIGKYKLEPGGYTFYGQPGIQEFVVDGYGSAKSVNLAYIPQRVEGGFTIYVFNDKNENGVRDDGEENVHYQNVRVTNLSGIFYSGTGNSANMGVGENGESDNQFGPGNYKFEMNPQDSSWDTYFKITKREVNMTFDLNTPHQTIYLGAHKLY